MKTTLVITIALLFVILVVACGGEPATPTAAPPTPTPAATPTPVPPPTPSATDHIQSGIDYYNQEKPDEAVNEFKKALELEPDNSDAYRNLGIIYAEQDQWEEAAAAIAAAAFLTFRSRWM